MAKKFGDVQTFFDSGNHLFRRLGPGLQKIIAWADAGSSGQSARGVARGLQPELFRGVGIEQVRFQHAVFDDDGAARGNAFAVEGTGAEAAGDGAVVDDGDVDRRRFSVPACRREKTRRGKPNRR